jgi:hypothetical protein
MVNFIDCASLSINYDIMGIVTINYTIVHDTESPIVYKHISAGGQSFVGYISNLSTFPVPNTEGWYETNVTLVCTSY